MNSYDLQLNKLDPESLYTFANWHEKQSLILRQRATVLAQRQKSDERVQKREEFLKTVPRAIILYLKKSYDLETAINRTCDDMGISPVTARSRWKNFMKCRNESTVRERNKLLFEMHTLGLPNTVIAKHLDLHPVSVSRLLKQIRTDYKEAV